MKNKIDIPNYNKKIFKQKNNDFALIIPVINEGKKIQKQLGKIQDNDLAVDVIIADGGSTDGSLNFDFWWGNIALLCVSADDWNFIRYLLLYLCSESTHPMAGY